MNQKSIHVPEKTAGFGSLLSLRRFRFFHWLKQRHRNFLVQYNQHIIIY